MDAPSSFICGPTGNFPQVPPAGEQIRQLWYFSTMENDSVVRRILDLCRNTDECRLRRVKEARGESPLPYSLYKTL